MSNVTDQRQQRLVELMQLARARAVASGATGRDKLRGERFLNPEEWQEFKALVDQFRGRANP
ncbi:gsl4368 [Gloeobacter violaceus PCC 7421]|uniref:Gsl4368 protein n=1 Tax=Gloeobacter violaceus (strain ATCC 29082 / PCC 7421) TaxID=251221 RepID=Q7ND68_GLOVI|nr:gsl4368 [Gloeobacter violaceus PCC 7421]